MKGDDVRIASGFLIFLSVATASAQTVTQQSPPLISVAPRQGPVIGPKTIVPAHVACTNLPVAAEPSAPLRILAPHAGDPHEFSYRNDVVVLSGGTPAGLMPGQRFFTRRFMPPRNGGAVSATARGSVRTSGWITVIAADEHSALGRVDYACDGIAAGDYLDAYVEPVLPPKLMADGPTDFGSLWRVLSGIDRRETFGAGDILTVDRGNAHGLATGMRVAFYRDRQNGTPLVELGTGIVVEITGEVSKVVVDRARFAIVTGDYVALRQP